jgi:hypothetical protein
MMAVMLDSGGRRACYISDLIPTSAHLDVTWVMGYDLYPLTCIEQRKRFLSRAIPEQWLVLFTHDHHHPMGYVEWGADGLIRGMGTQRASRARAGRQTQPPANGWVVDPDDRISGRFSASDSVSSRSHVAGLC